MMVTNAPAQNRGQMGGQPVPQGNAHEYLVVQQPSNQVYLGGETFSHNSTPSQCQLVSHVDNLQQVLENQSSQIQINGDPLYSSNTVNSPSMYKTQQPQALFAQAAAQQYPPFVQSQGVLPKHQHQASHTLFQTTYETQRNSQKVEGGAHGDSMNFYRRFKRMNQESGSASARQDRESVGDRYQTTAQGVEYPPQQVHTYSEPTNRQEAPYLLEYPRNGKPAQAQASGHPLVGQRAVPEGQFLGDGTLADSNGQVRQYKISLAGSQNTNLAMAGYRQLVQASMPMDNPQSFTRNTPQLSPGPAEIVMRPNAPGGMLSAVSSQPVTFDEPNAMIAERGLFIHQQPASQQYVGGVESQREVGAFERGVMASNPRLEQPNSYVSTSQSPTGKNSTCSQQPYLLAQDRTLSDQSLLYQRENSMIQLGHRQASSFNQHGPQPLMMAPRQAYDSFNYKQCEMPERITPGSRSNPLSQSLYDQMSMISYSATKQVRFKNASQNNNTSMEDETYDNADIHGVNETQLQSHQRHYAAMGQRSPLIQNARPAEHTQDTAKNYKSSILSKKRSISPVSQRNNVKSISPASTKKRAVGSKSRPRERKPQSSVGVSTRGRNSRAVDAQSGRSKSNKSRLSQRSSLSCVSTRQRSQKKSLSRKHSRSVNQQQIEEYNKFSSKNARKAALHGEPQVQIIAIKGSKAGNIRVGNLSAKKSRSVGRTLGGSRKFHTIMIEADGLSSQQISQLDKVSRILNNDRLYKSPKKSPKRTSALSAKKRSASAKKRRDAVPCKDGSSKARKQKSGQSRGRERSETRSQYYQDECQNLDLAETQVTRGRHMRGDGLGFDQESSAQGNQLMMSQQIQPMYSQFHHPHHARIHSMLPAQGQMHPQPIKQHYDHGRGDEALSQQVSVGALSAAPQTQILLNGVGSQQFMTMHEYASPKYVMEGAEPQLWQAERLGLNQSISLQAPSQGRPCPPPAQAQQTGQDDGYSRAPPASSHTIQIGPSGTWHNSKGQLDQNCALQHLSKTIVISHRQPGPNAITEEADSYHDPGDRKAHSRSTGWEAQASTAANIPFQRQRDQIMPHDPHGVGLYLVAQAEALTDHAAEYTGHIEDERNPSRYVETMAPIDDALIDHLSQRKDTIRGTFRGSVKAGLNNDDIDEVVGDVQEPLLELPLPSEEGLDQMDGNMTEPTRAQPVRQDENEEGQRPCQSRNCEATCENSQRQSQQDHTSKQTAMTDVTANRSRLPDFVSHISGHEDKESYTTTPIQQLPEISHRPENQHHAQNILPHTKTISQVSQENSFQNQIYSQDIRDKTYLIQTLSVAGGLSDNQGRCTGQGEHENRQSLATTIEPDPYHRRQPAVDEVHQTTRRAQQQYVGNSMEAQNVSSRQQLQFLQGLAGDEGNISAQEMNRRLVMLAEEQDRRAQARDREVVGNMGRGQAVQRNAHRAKFISFNDSMRLNQNFQEKFEGEQLEGSIEEEQLKFYEGESAQQEPSQDRQQAQPQQVYVYQAQDAQAGHTGRSQQPFVLVSPISEHTQAVPELVGSNGALRVVPQTSGPTSYFYHLTNPTGSMITSPLGTCLGPGQTGEVYRSTLPSQHGTLISPPPQPIFESRPQQFEPQPEHRPIDLASSDKMLVKRLSAGPRSKSQKPGTSAPVSEHPILQIKLNRKVKTRKRALLDDKSPSKYSQKSHKSQKSTKSKHSHKSVKAKRRRVRQMESISPCSSSRQMDRRRPKSLKRAQLKIRFQPELSATLPACQAEVGPHLQDQQPEGAQNLCLMCGSDQKGELQRFYTLRSPNCADFRPEAGVHNTAERPAPVYRASLLAQDPASIPLQQLNQVPYTTAARVENFDGLSGIHQGYTNEHSLVEYEDALGLVNHLDAQPKYNQNGQAAMAIFENQSRNVSSSVCEGNSKPDRLEETEAGQSSKEQSKAQQQPENAIHENKLVYDPETQILYARGEDGSLVHAGVALQVVSPGQHDQPEISKHDGHPASKQGETSLVKSTDTPGFHDSQFQAQLLRQGAYPGVECFPAHRSSIQSLNSGAFLKPIQSASKSRTLPRPPRESANEGIHAAEYSTSNCRNLEGAARNSVEGLDPRYINYYESCRQQSSLTGPEGRQQTHPSFEPITNINLPTGCFAGHSSRENIGRTMRLIRREGNSLGPEMPNRALARKSKRALSGTLPTRGVARNRSTKEDSILLAAGEPQKQKSKKRAGSAGGRQYRKSIDRIVKSPAKKMLVRDMINLTPTYPRRQQRIGKAAMSLSAKSLLLPKKRVLVSPFRNNFRRDPDDIGVLPNRRARSAFGQTLKPQSRKNLEYSLQKTKLRKCARNAYRQQQETVKRLHLAGQKPRSQTGFGARSLKALVAKRTSFLSLDRVRPAACTPGKRRCQSTLGVSNPKSGLCRKGQCRDKVRIEKEKVRGIEQARHEREAKAQQQILEEKLRTRDRSWGARMEMIRSSIRTEKAKAKCYADTIAEMSEKMEKVNQKKQALYEKIQCQKRTYQDKLKAQKDGFEKTFERLSSKNGRAQGTRNTKPYAAFGSNNDPNSLVSVLTSSASQNTHDLTLTVPDHERLSQQEAGATERIAKEGKKRRSKSRTAGQASQVSITHDKVSQRLPEQRVSEPKMIDKCISKQKSLLNDDRKSTRRSSIPFHKKQGINQLSTFDINMNTHQDNNDTINIAKSRMLEPNMNLPNSRTIDRSSFRSYGGANQVTSTIYTGGQQLAVTSRGQQSKKGNNFSLAGSKNHSQMLIVDQRRQATKRESAREAMTMTQTSTYSSYDQHSEKLNSLSNKIKNNNQEIKRIENILYSKDKKVPRHLFMTGDSARDSVKSNRLASNQQHIQAFARRVRELEHKKYGKKDQAWGSKVGEHQVTSGSGRHLFGDDISLSKMKKIDLIDKQTTCTQQITPNRLYLQDLKDYE